MKSESTPPARNKLLTMYLVSNFCFVLLMLAAILLIRSGQTSFLPHAKIDREFVSDTLANGTAKDIDHALKATEVYRAAGYESLVGMMDLMQVTALVLALLFVINGFVLFRLRQPAPVPAQA